MSCTYTIDHISTTVEDVSVEVAEKANMVLQGSPTVDQKTGERSATYVLATGDNAYPAFITYRSSTETRAKGPVRKASMTFSTWAVSTDSISGVETRKPVSATMSFVLPADMTIEVADFNQLVGNLFSYLYLSVSAKVRDTTWLAKLLFGVVQVK